MGDSGPGPGLYRWAIPDDGERLYSPTPHPHPKNYVLDTEVTFAVVRVISALFLKETLAAASTDEEHVFEALFSTSTLA